MSLEYENIEKTEKKRKISKKRVIIYLLLRLGILGLSIMGIVFFSSYYILMGGAF